VKREKKGGESVEQMLESMDKKEKKSGQLTEKRGSCPSSVSQKEGGKRIRRKAVARQSERREKREKMSRPF